MSPCDVAVYAEYSKIMKSRAKKKPPLGIAEAEIF